MAASKLHHVVLQRLKDDGTSILGVLHLYDVYNRDLFTCYTLESSLHSILSNDAYLSYLSYSPKFQTELPYIDVPSRVGIRIHYGNTFRDTKGCVLVGDSYTRELDCLTVLNSRKTLKRIVEYYRSAGSSYAVRFYVTDINVDELPF